MLLLFLIIRFLIIVSFGLVLGLSNQVRSRPIRLGASPLHIRSWGALGWGVENFSRKLSSCVSSVKHPSGDGDAVYLIKIAAEVLVFIKDYRALV